MIRILIVDDHAVVREGLKNIFEPTDDLQVAGEAANFIQAMELFQSLRPDVTLMDVHLPGTISGIETLEEIRAKYSDARILMLSTFDREEDIYHALQAGARGYVLKDFSAPELIQAIRNVHAGQRLIPSSIAAGLAQRLEMDEL